MKSKMMVNDLPELDDHIPNCKICQFGKQSRKPFPKTTWRASKKAWGQKETLIATKSYSGSLHEDPLADLNLKIHSTNGNGENALLEKGTRVVKLLAAFRGYLAHRVFKALKGIIRLQALVRGHLVKRQAIATLINVKGIVKLQAMIHGRRVRFSDPGLKIQKILNSKQEATGCDIFSPQE
ncbi:hypothetical protein RJ641_014421 [Dillenia turbinata]|uniref:Uncharacterized protein n=1 Tax=Dillenia turbinata TaxID=194707 RepID=A0AAN8V3I4_9MAGN